MQSPIHHPADRLLFGSSKTILVPRTARQLTQRRREVLQVLAGPRQAEAPTAAGSLPSRLKVLNLVASCVEINVSPLSSYGAPNMLLLIIFPVQLGGCVALMS